MTRRHVQHKLSLQLYDTEMLHSALQHIPLIRKHFTYTHDDQWEGIGNIFEDIHSALVDTRVLTASSTYDGTTVPHVTVPHLCDDFAYVSM